MRPVEAATTMVVVAVPRKRCRALRRGGAGRGRGEWGSVAGREGWAWATKGSRGRERAKARTRELMQA